MSVRHLVVDLMSTVPHMRMPSWVADRLSADTLDGWRLTVIASPSVSVGSGRNAASEETMAAIVDAEAYFGYGVPELLIEAAPQLRWAHSMAAGVGGSISPAMRERGLVFTNSAGQYGEGIADTVLGGVIHFLRGLDIAVRQQAASRWDQTTFPLESTRLREIDECRVLVIGAGGIGSAVARRFSALGCTCTGIRRRPELGPLPGFSRVVGPEALEAELPGADVVVLAAPSTEATYHLLDGPRLALLPPGAIVVNVARGSLIAEESLVEALDSGRIRGAVLDVFHTEPLPPESHWWQHPRVLITPHVSGVSPRRQWERALELFEDNWRRWVAGDPLRNVVDLDAGY
ncbi:MAG: D-2-hydroxyacid dehydrogenase [Gemmatimonadaceae bacterium]|nr:D-2-hydroxyacid dehydrogenase [Gemmatimonadaceae bacterium]